LSQSVVVVGESGCRQSGDGSPHLRLYQHLLSLSEATFTAVQGSCQWTVVVVVVVVLVIAVVIGTVVVVVVVIVTPGKWEVLICPLLMYYCLWISFVCYV